MIARRAVACMAALLLAGCGAAHPGTEQTPLPATGRTSAASAPSEGASLRDFGVENGPAALMLPKDLVVDYRVDNPNNVTLVIDVGQGLSTYQFLRRNLSGAGFRITADGQQSLTFTGRGWEGAYTVSESVAALTLRTP
ncbi:hypothetical protein [Acidipropionibacterium virtanenii]|uniref:Uncharacterized protein n=1 Tax=Acidipropionibacterium virtanenii TaxID=2057246 RepID=A0A344USL2_9ACTN|nr:hypothetical protein [Acidipropionibacterium virtanenii]AXE38260.1 hypothetical protein JS278_01077 [Acidipropionibacterium virtanenii]